MYKDILYNGLDFLLHSLTPLDDIDDIDEVDAEFVDTLPKYLILNVIAATELILKARLYKEHWALIFQTVDKASVELRDSGDFSSVNFDTCISRLEKIAGVYLDAESRKSLYELRRRRNSFEHLRIPPKLHAVGPLVGRCLDIIIAIVDSWFEPGDFNDEANRIVELLRPRRSTFHALREHRLNRLANQLEQVEHLARCPICGEYTLELNPVDICLFCGWSEQATKVAEMVAAYEESQRKNRLFQPTLFPDLCPPLPYAHVACCQECGVNSLLVRSQDEAGNKIVSFICFSCGSLFELSGIP